MTDELVKALLVEEVAEERSIAEALFATISGGMPLVQALVDAGAVAPEVLARYLGRADAPFLKHVVPVAELVERLPAGLCARLLAVPVRRDAITGTIDVVVADPKDLHPASEIAFHLGAPVRLIRAPVVAIVAAVRKMGALSRPPSSRPAPRPAPPRVGPRDDEPLSYDSRPRAPLPVVPPAARTERGLGGGAPSPHLGPEASASKRMATLPPPGAGLVRPSAHPYASYRPPSSASTDALLAALDAHALRRSQSLSNIVPAPEPTVSRKASRDTPPWGTPVHNAGPASGSDPPTSGLGSEIPIPLTRRTFSAVSARGGTQRPPPLAPDRSPLGEGYPVPVDPKTLQVVEVRDDRAVVGRTDAERDRRETDSRQAGAATEIQSFIPGPPPVPGVGSFAAFAPRVPLADLGGILSAIRAAGSRDEVLELVLTGARMLAFRVALFVVKRGGYLGWACTSEFADRAALQSVLVPLDAASVFDQAVRDGVYLGPIAHDAVHAPLLHVMRGATADVAFVPVRVRGKTAVVIVADELGDTMIATRRLEEVARAAGESFARIVRTRR